MDEFVVAGYVVTARHVIEDIQIASTDDKAILRVNEMGGGLIRIDTNCDDWFFHPTDSNVDVAVMPISFRGRQVNQNFLSTAAFATAAASSARIGIGEEVFITGLFTSHFGKKKNIPIVRVGNIAAMPDEPIKTKLGLVEGYLIEARSLGGLSGSPVFALTVEPERPLFDTQQPTTGFWVGGKPARIPTVPVGAKVEIDAEKFAVEVKLPETMVLVPGEHTQSFCLLGLMHGHFDASETSQTDSVVEDSQGGPVNVGIGVVVPSAKILEVLEHPKLKEMRAKLLDDYEKSITATPD